MRNEKLVTVYEVLADVPYPGPWGDGVKVSRFRSESCAKAFAKGARLYGQPNVPVTSVNVPKSVAARWGIIGG